MTRNILDGELEIDEGYVTSYLITKEEKEPTKRGRGSQNKTTVLVIASTLKEENVKKRKKTKLKYVKMYVIPSLEKEVIEAQIKKAVSPKSRAKTDAYPSYNGLGEILESHQKLIASGKDAPKKLPWVHICLANLKRWLLGIHHAVSKTYIQNYLDEFCFRTNRRSFTNNSFFDRIVFNATQFSW